MLFLHFVACRWLWPFWQISQKVSFPGKNMHRSQFIISRQQPKTFERWMWSTWIYGAFRSWKAGWGLFKLVFVQWLYYNPIDASSNFLSLRSWELSNFDISPFPAPVKLSSIKIEEFLKAWQFQGFLDSTGKKVHHQPIVNELLRPKYLPIWGHRRPGTKHWHNRYRFNVHWTMDNPLGLHESSRSNIPAIQ